MLCDNVNGVERIEKIKKEETRARAGVARSEIKLVRTRTEKDRGRCSNENTMDGNEGRPKIGRPKEVVRCHIKRH